MLFLIFAYWPSPFAYSQTGQYKPLCGQTGPIQERIRDCNEDISAEFHLVLRNQDGKETFYQIQPKRLWGPVSEPLFAEDIKLCEKNSLPPIPLKQITGDWRLPTYKEFGYFITDPKAFDYIHRETNSLLVNWISNSERMGKIIITTHGSWDTQFFPIKTRYRCVTEEINID